MKTTMAVATTLAMGLTLVASTALAQGRAEIRAAQAQWQREPTVNDCVQQALAYFRLSPDEFDGYRSAARARGLVPTLAAGYRLDDNRIAFGSDRAITEPWRIDTATDQRIHAISAGLIFNLGDLVYNPAEVQIYGLVGVQRDIMLETTRTYFLRRQLLLRMATRPPEDPIAYAALELAIAEYTALLDVLTGGWFSEQLARRARSAPRR
jgi:hypothetical protein